MTTPANPVMCVQVQRANMCPWNLLEGAPDRIPGWSLEMSHM